MNTETLDQKINRLEKTIGRCTYQINDTRNTDEVIDIFTKAKAEAERQLAEIKAANKPENAAQKDIKPHLSGEKEQSGDVSSIGVGVTSQPSLPATKPEKQAPAAIITPHYSGQMQPADFENDAQPISSPSTDTPHLSGETQSITPHANNPQVPTIYATGSGSTRMVRIEWVGGKKAPVTLTEGQTRSRFTSTLRDCAESQPAIRENWEKLMESQSFQNLVTYYRALALFPRPSGAEMPTMEDIGRVHFLGKVRGRIWGMLQNLSTLPPL